MAGRMVRDAASGSDPRRTASDLARRGRVVTALALAAVVAPASGWSLTRGDPLPDAPKE